MIIVKTNNGDRFINEKETICVTHNKGNATVEVKLSRRGNRKQPAELYIIENVESVQYLHGKDIQWKDEGSKVEKLKTTIENKNMVINSKDKEISRIIRRARYVAHWLEIHRDAIYKIKELAKKAIVGIGPEAINAIIEDAEKKYEKSQKEFDEMLEKEGGKLNLYAPICPR